MRRWQAAAMRVAANGWGAGPGRPDAGTWWREVEVEVDKPASTSRPSKTGGAGAALGRVRCHKSWRAATTAAAGGRWSGRW